MQLIIPVINARKQTLFSLYDSLLTKLVVVTCFAENFVKREKSREIDGILTRCPSLILENLHDYSYFTQFFYAL